MKSLLNFTRFTVFGFMLVFTSFGDEEDKLKINRSYTVELDMAQNLSKNNATGNASVGTVELDVDFECPGNIGGMLAVLAENDMSAVSFDEASMRFKPVDRLEIKGGHFLMPFGELSTELLTDPLIIDAVETKAAGVRAGIKTGLFTASAAIYNFSGTNRLEAGAARAAYSFKESGTISVSLRSRPGMNADMDAAVSVPVSVVTFIGEAYKSISRPEGQNIPVFGFYGELNVNPVEPLMVAARFERSTEGAQNSTGTERIAAGSVYSLNKHISTGVEFDLDASVLNGIRSNWQKSILMRLTLGIEQE